MLFSCLEFCLVFYFTPTIIITIETSDRGEFTPLINAAWAGDKYLVRFFLQKGANRCKFGTGHYTEPLAPPDFKGHTAEEWARKKGHDEIADFIRMGL